MENYKNLFSDLKNYSPQPSDKVWKNIEHRLDASNKGSASFKRWGIISGIVIVSVVGITIAVLSFLSAETLPKVSPLIEYPKKVQQQVDIQVEITDSIPVQNNIATPLDTTKKLLKKSESVVKTDEQILNPTTEIKQPEKPIVIETPIVAKAHSPLPETVAIEKIETQKKVIITDDFEADDSIASIEYTYIDLHQNQSICRGEKAVIQVVDGYNILWSSGETVRTLTVNPTETTEYQVTWQEEGNYFKSNIRIEVLNCSMFVPNAFTPNGDGINDKFRPVCEGITNFRMLIFSQNGNQLFESSNITYGWDGTLHGRKMEEGVYIYRISFTDIIGKSHNIYGTFSLLP